MLNIKNDDQYIESSRDWKLGSLILFNIEFQEINKLNLTNLQMKRVLKLFEASCTKEDKCLTKTCIANILDLKKPSTSRFIQSLVERGVIERISNFTHHSNRSNLFAYKFTGNNESINKTTSATSLKVSTPSQPILMTDDYPLASRYNKRANTSLDDFHVVNEQSMVSSWFGIPASVTLEHIFATNGANTKKSTNILGKYIKENDQKVKFETEITSESSVLELSDTQFLYTLISLTIEYHSAVHSDYLKGNGESIKNITPIARDDIRDWLELPDNGLTRKFIDKKLNQFENNKISIKVSTEIDDKIAIDKKGRRFFEIKGTKSYSQKNKEPLPYVYFIAWDINIIQEIFKTEIIFIYPKSVIHQPYIIFYLYKFARNMMHHTTNIELSLNNLKNSLPIAGSDIDIINVLWKGFKKAFKNTDEKIIEVFAGKTNRSKLIEIALSGELGGMHLSIKGTELNTKRPMLTVNIKIDKDAVIYESQPINMRSRYFNSNGNMPIANEDLLKEDGRGHKSPIKFSSSLPLVHHLIDAEDEFIISTSKPVIKSLQLEATPVPIKKRKYWLNITANNSTYNITRYCSNSIIEGYILDICQLTNNSHSTIAGRISKALPDINLLSCLDGKTISPELFEELTSDLDSSPVEIAYSAMKRNAVLGNIPIENKSELKEFFFICAT